MRNKFPLDFIKCLSYSEVEKNSKVVNVWIRSLWVCSKSTTETFLVSEYIFKFSLSLWGLQVIRDLLCLRGITEKSLNRMLLLLILRTSHRKCSVKRSAWKSCQFHRKMPVLESFLTNLQAWGPEAFSKRDSNTCIFPVKFAKFLRAPILKYICKLLLLYLQVNFIYNAWKRYS